MRIERLSILGTGLLGGSIGLACRKTLKSLKISGYDHKMDEIRRALKREAIDEGFGDLAAAVAGADMIIFCTPVGVFGEILGKIAGSLKAGVIVTDVGSTKRSIVKLAEQTLPSNVHFVGSHPMAGGEKQGIEHARADLLTGAKCIITPTSTTDAKAVEGVKTFWQELQMQTLQMSPELHDQLVSDISHLPHAVAAALVRMQSSDALKLAARGFTDTTRIAAGGSGLWRDILLDNRDNLKASIRRLQEELTILSTRLDAGDDAGIRDWLTQAAEVRKQFEQGRERDSQ